MTIECESPAYCQAVLTDLNPIVTEFVVASVIFIIVFWIGFHFVTARLARD